MGSAGLPDFAFRKLCLSWASGEENLLAGEPMTLKEIAVECVKRFRAAPNAFARLDDVVGYIHGSWTLSEDQLQTLLELIRAEFRRTGGEPYIVHDGSNAASVSLVAMMSARIRAKRGK